MRFTGFGAVLVLMSSLSWAGEPKVDVLDGRLEVVQITDTLETGDCRFTGVQGKNVSQTNKNLTCRKKVSEVRDLLYISPATQEEVHLEFHFGKEDGLSIAAGHSVSVYFERKETGFWMQVEKTDLADLASVPHYLPVTEDIAMQAIEKAVQEIPVDLRTIKIKALRFVRE